jgi:hypothetical protein
MRTHFQDFLLDDGSPVTVEYSVSGSYSPTTYSPMHGADGGDAPEFCVLKAWPKAPQYDALVQRWSVLEWASWVTPWQYLVWCWLGLRIRVADWAVRPSTAERERMEAWLAEHHVQDYDDEPADYEYRGG